MNEKVAFIGGGSFGTALSVLLSKKGISVNIWDRDTDVVNNINEKRENNKYIKNLVIPKGITAYTDLSQAVKGADYIVLAVPSHVIRTISRTLKEYINDKQIIVSIAKGIEEGSCMRLSEVIKQELSGNAVVILSGPSHAEEVALDLPTTLVASSTEMEYAKKVQDIFMTSKLRVYTNNDLVGVEIGGAVKNIIALAAGISDGIGFGDNSKAALMTRGMSEIIRIGIKMGGKIETFSGLTGMGDLIVTCTSMHSRNRRAGILIGKGISAEEATKEIGMVVEGIKACKAFYELRNKLQVSMPITETLYDVLFNHKEVKSTVYDLMSRDKKDESY